MARKLRFVLPENCALTPLILVINGTARMAEISFDGREKEGTEGINNFKIRINIPLVLKI